MQQINVPQFLDVEDRIIGSITIRQFIELLIGGLLDFIYYKIFDFSLFLLCFIITTGFVLLLAFVKIQGQMFHMFLLNVIKTIKSPRLKIWKRDPSLVDLNYLSKTSTKVAVVKSVSRMNVNMSRLSELALIVDTGGVYKGEDNI